MSKFKPGDRVIVAYRHDTFCKVGSMDRYVGGTFEVYRRDGIYCNLYDDGVGRVLGEKAGFHWLFHEDCLIKDGPYAKYHAIAREICGH